MNLFYEEVIQGLSASPKYLKSKYFYDKRGDELFQQIMNLPEYYLTNCEEEIFSQQTQSIADAFLSRYNEFDIVELGAGDATKSSYLLRYLLSAGKPFTYYPIDISKNVIKLLETELPKQMPQLSIHGLQGEYFDMLQQANALSHRQKVVLFLGSNIGNFTITAATQFLKSLQAQLTSGDRVLIGFDLKKNPKIILAAYDDSAGITKAFNLNLLTRINRELGADFTIKNFDHYATYDPITGTCKSYAISLQPQRVTIGDKTFEFEANEPIHMELSQKYTVAETDTMAAAAGFKPVHYFYDSKKWFLDAVWERM